MTAVLERSADRSPYVENSQYVAFMRRIIRAAGRRASADVDALPQLRDLQRELDDTIRRSVQACRDEGYSWSEIAQRLGVTKQAAQQRYGRAGDARP